MAATQMFFPLSLTARDGSFATRPRITVTLLTPDGHTEREVIEPRETARLLQSGWVTALCGSCGETAEHCPELRPHVPASRYRWDILKGRWTWHQRD